MSVLTADIIKSAYRRAGILAAGSTGVPTLNTATTLIGLERLNALYLKWVTSGLLGTLTDYYLASGDYQAEEYQKILQVSNASVITYPASIVDVNTGETRAPINTAVVMVVNVTTNVPVIKIYDGMLGKWMSAYGLVIGSEAPLGDQYGEAIKDCLGIELCGEGGYPIPPLLARNASMGRLSIASKLNQPRRGVATEYF